MCYLMVKRLLVGSAFAVLIQAPLAAQSEEDAVRDVLVTYAERM